MIKLMSFKWYGMAGSKSKGDVVQVTWDNVEELEAYIAKLKKAADQLSIENRQLRRCHFNISDKVRKISLMDERVSIATYSLVIFLLCSSFSSLACTFVRSVQITDDCGWARQMWAYKALAVCETQGHAGYYEVNSTVSLKHTTLAHGSVVHHPYRHYSTHRGYTRIGLCLEAGPQC